MTSDRPYRSGLQPEEAMAELRKGAGRQWDAAMVEGLLHLLEGGIVGRVTTELISAHAR